MTHVLLFHHAQGLTDGVHHFAESLRAAGHEVTTPDLYEGRTFGSVEEGVAHAQQIGFDTIVERGRLAAEALPADVVYAGFSLGVMPAQTLAQTRPGAKGALFFHACLPTSEIEGSWPGRLPVQVHGMDADPFFSAEGDLDAARELVRASRAAQLFLYPGDRHLFADDSLDSYDEAAARLLTQRVLSFLGRLARVDPEPRDGERELLGQYLDYQRETVLAKTDGLDREQMARRMPSSDLSLAGLLRHLALVEEVWAEGRFLGLPLREPWSGVDWKAYPEWDFRTAGDVEPEQLRRRYRDACDRSRRVLSEASDLDQLSAKPLADGRHFSLRWMLLHLVEETARHAGHADLLRELIDGSAGD